MAITKVKDGWRVSVEYGRTIDGKRDRKTKVCKTKAEATKCAVQFEIERSGFKGHSNRMTLRRFTEDYYLPMKRDVLRRSTMRVYENTIENHLMPVFGDMQIASIGRLEIQAMISSRKTVKAARNARDAIRQILGEALQMDLLTSNPAAGRFKFPEKIEDTKTPTWLTSFADHKTIIDAASGDVRTILVLGLCFGLRKGEIMGMDWSCIDFARKELTVKQTYTQSVGAPDLTPPKTQRSARTIPMTDYAARELLRARGDVLRVGPVLVRHGRRMTPAMAYRSVDTFFNQHPELPRVTILSLRHSFASASIIAGVDVATVSKWLGHCDVSTTLNRYVKPLSNDLRSAADKIDALYG